MSVSATVNDPELLLARLVRGEASLRDAKAVRAKSFASVELKWLWALVTTVLEEGVIAPSAEQVLHRTWSGITATDEFLAERSFLEEVTEEELRSELGRLRCMAHSVARRA